MGISSEAIRRAFKATERITDADGEWLSLRAAHDHTGFSYNTLARARVLGTPWLPGHRKCRRRRFPDGLGQKRFYLLKADLDAMVEAAGRGQAVGPGEVSFGAAVKKLRVSARTIRTALNRQNVPVVERLVKNKNGRAYYAKFVPEGALAGIERREDRRDTWRRFTIEDGEDLWLSTAVALERYPKIHKDALRNNRNRPSPAMAGGILRGMEVYIPERKRTGKRFWVYLDADLKVFRPNKTGRRLIPAAETYPDAHGMWHPAPTARQLTGLKHSELRAAQAALSCHYLDGRQRPRDPIPPKGQRRPLRAKKVPNKNRARVRDRRIWVYHEEDLKAIAAKRGLCLGAAQAKRAAVEQAPTPRGLSASAQDFLDRLFDCKAFSPLYLMSSDEVAERLKPISPGNLRRVAADLKRRGLVDSQRGQGGGYWLTGLGKVHVQAARQ